MAAAKPARVITMATFPGDCSPAPGARRCAGSHTCVVLFNAGSGPVRRKLSLPVIHRGEVSFEIKTVNPHCSCILCCEFTARIYLGSKSMCEVFLWSFLDMHGVGEFESPDMQIPS